MGKIGRPRRWRLQEAEPTDNPLEPYLQLGGVTRHLAFGARTLYRALALGEPEGYERGRRFRNVVHGISVDAFATIHF